MKLSEPQLDAIEAAVGELWGDASPTRDQLALLPDVLESAELMVVPATITPKNGGMEPELKPGQIWNREDGSRYMRVRVISGRGGYAYWHRQQPNGKDAGWQVVADVVENFQTPHRAGMFTEPFEGKPGTLAWVRMKSNA